MKTQPKFLNHAIGAFLLACLSAEALNAAPDKVPPVVPMPAQFFPLQEVRLLEGPFHDAMVRDRDYLLSLQPERLLHTFRLNAGLADSAQPLGGWEEPSCELRGHSLGHYLSACSLMFASTGDERLKQRVDTLVVGLAQCQQALAARCSHPGYLSAFPESFIERVENRQNVWAPWYTLHKIMAGLLDAYQLCGNVQALEVLTRMADWVQFRVERLSPEQMQRSLDTEHGGMNEVLANLYAVTGNPAHLRLARAFEHQKVFEPLAAGQDHLDRLHANTQIPKMIGAAREFELTGETRYRDIAQFFWERVALHRSYAIGGHSDQEHFFPVTDFARHLSAETCETCNTYNMLKLTRHLFSWAPEAATMDFYERALYNHILASQDPRTGMFVYLMPLKPGHFKSYSTPEDSFWCCVGTGMENHARYGETIYAHDDHSLWVNLFIASELTWREKGLHLRQETQFPQHDSTRLVFKCERPLQLALKLRWPAWAESVSVRINGKDQVLTSQPDSYIELDRVWCDGDRVEVRLSMKVYAEPLPGTTNEVALLCGPIVLAGELGTNNLPSPYLRVQTDQAHLPTPPTPVFVASNSSWLEQIVPAGAPPLTFRTKHLARPQEVRLVPFYQVHHERYTVYWPVLSEREWAQEELHRQQHEQAERDLAGRTVDLFAIGQEQAERDHQVRGEKSDAVEFAGRKLRHAYDGGWFSFQVAVPTNSPADLIITYWGGETGKRQFDVLVDGQTIATTSLHQDSPGQFWDKHYPLPASLIGGKSRVTVKFQALPGNFAGGVFGVRVVRAQEQ